MLYGQRTMNIRNNVSARSWRRGSLTVEYAVAICGFVMILSLAVAVTGIKQVDVLGMTAATMPGAHPADNGGIEAGELFPVVNDNGVMRLDMEEIVNQRGTARLGEAFGDQDLEDFVVNSGRVNSTP